MERLRTESWRFLQHCRLEIEDLRFVSYKILTYDEIDKQEWGRLIRESRTGTWFQSPEAYEFFCTQKDLMEPFVFAVEAVGSLRALCVGYVTKEHNSFKQFFTRRAIINGGICCANDATNKEVMMLLTAIREQLSDKTIYIETRNFEDYSRWREAFEAAGFGYKKHLNFHVDCTDEEVMWERLSENRKRQIRKGERLSVIGDGLREEDIIEWYGILERLYRTKVKTPLWPVEFFLEAYRQGIGKFLLVKHDNLVIGGSMVVVWKGLPVTGYGLREERLGTVYEWFECGMNAEYKEQYPSVMATWAGMQLAHELGCARYDMMGAGEPGVPYGVRDFKSEFGGKLVEHGRFLCVCKPWLYKIGELGVKLLKR